jgi:hypothetical protein
MQALLTDHVHRRFVGIADCPTTQELRRARRLVLEDNSVGALRSGRALLQQDSASPGRRAYAAAICRFSHWRLRDIDGVYSVELPRPPLVSSRRYLFPAIITRCIEAAIELEQLRLTTARRLALDALDMADSLCGPHARIAALPATLVAQVLYEQGYSSAAHTLIRDRFAAINSSGVLECPLRAYSVLAGIAMQAGKEAQALELLQDAELLGLERDWSRQCGLNEFACCCGLSARMRLRLARNAWTGFLPVPACGEAVANSMRNIIGVEHGFNWRRAASRLLLPLTTAVSCTRPRSRAATIMRRWRSRCSWLYV